MQRHLCHAHVLPQRYIMDSDCCSLRSIGPLHAVHNLRLNLMTLSTQGVDACRGHECPLHARPHLPGRQN